MAADELAAHEAALAALSERAEAAQQTWFRLSALAERVSATVRIASERAQHLDAETAVDGRPRPRRVGGRGRAGRRRRAAAARRACRLPAAGSTPPAPSWPSASASPPRPSRRTWRRCRPRPTAGKAWPGWPARWRRCGPASSRSTTVWPGCPTASRRPPPAPSRPRPSSRPCRAGSVSSTRAKSASTNTTTARWLRCGWPTNASPNCRPPSAARNVRWPRCWPASMRCRWAWTARTAPHGSMKIEAVQDFSDRSPIWSRSVRATRPRWPRCSVRRPTRWPPTTSVRPARR